MNAARRLSQVTANNKVYIAGDETSGGGEKFVSFIEKELVPYINNKYPTEPYKMLIGYSIGGLAAVQTFVHHTDLFNSYICIDPSVWWDNQALIKESRKALINKKFQGTSLFLAFSSVFDIGMDIKEVSTDTTDGGIKYTRTILEWRNSLEDYKENGLKFQRKYYKDDSHGTVSLIAEYDGFRFIFNDYVLKISDKDMSDSTIDLLGKCKLHYSKVSKQMGYEVKPPGRMINDMGYWALNEKQFRKAEDFFKYNVGRYPGSYKVYVAMGDYYAAIGNASNAIINYKKSLSIEEIEDIRKKLEKIQSK